MRTQTLGNKASKLALSLLCSALKTQAEPVVELPERLPFEPQYAAEIGINEQIPLSANSAKRILYHAYPLSIVDANKKALIIYGEEEGKARIGIYLPEQEYWIVGTDNDPDELIPDLSKIDKAYSRLGKKFIPEGQEDRITVDYSKVRNPSEHWETYHHLPDRVALAQFGYQRREYLKEPRFNVSDKVSRKDWKNGTKQGVGCLRRDC